MAGSNRAQRRAEARNNKSDTPSFDSAADIPMAQPDRSGPKAKTLMDIAEEKRKELMKEHPEAFGLSAQDDEDETTMQEIHRDGDWTFMSSEPLGAFGDACVYTVALAMLHFTLDVLVYNQYRQEILFTEVFLHVSKVFLPLFIAVYITHTPEVLRFKNMRNILFFGLSTFAGCWLIKAGNKDGYYAVMSRAPPLGTLWVWSVVEMGLYFAVTHVAVVGSYTYMNGFTTF